MARMTVKARMKLALTAKITEMPIIEMNSPAAPGIRAIGAKAKIVVSVEAASGANRWRTAWSSAPSGASEHPGLRRLNVMVVEDNAVNQLVIDSILRSIGIHATLLNDGAQALRRVSERPGNWDVIFMDCEMPVMDGYTAARKLREHGYTRPIIALTAHAMTDDAMKCVEAGCDDYASKPVNRQKLLELVDRYGSDVGSGNPGIRECSAKLCSNSVLFGMCFVDVR